MLYAYAPQREVIRDAEKSKVKPYLRTKVRRPSGVAAKILSAKVLTIARKALL